MIGHGKKQVNQEEKIKKWNLATVSGDTDAILVLKIPQLDGVYPSWTCPIGYTKLSSSFLHTLQVSSDGIMAKTFSLTNIKSNFAIYIIQGASQNLRSFILWKIQGLPAVTRFIGPLRQILHLLLEALAQLLFKHILALFWRYLI